MDSGILHHDSKFVYNAYRLSFLRGKIALYDSIYRVGMAPALYDRCFDCLYFVFHSLNVLL
jgi:hypothetical protein